MNSKWYISILVVALMFLGIAAETSVAPNQEIVVHFSANGDAKQGVDNALETVRAKLLRIGVSDIQVVATFDGNLKITYFSSTDITAVKALFENDQELNLAQTSFTNHTPFEKEEQHFELNVSEIASQSENDLGLNGVLIEIKSANDRYLHPVVYPASVNEVYASQHIVASRNCALYVDTALLTDSSSYKIPEVRAGPIA